LDGLMPIGRDFRQRTKEIERDGVVEGVVGWSGGLDRHAGGSARSLTVIAIVLRKTMLTR